MNFPEGYTAAFEFYYLSAPGGPKAKAESHLQVGALDILPRKSQSAMPA